MQEVQRTDSPLQTTVVSSSGEAAGDGVVPAVTGVRWEWPIVIGLLLIAFCFRVWQLNDVPPGLHHDEVIIGQVAKDILRGHLGVYFTAGYGHEPLYHYAVAGLFSAIGANAFALRLTSVFVGMLGLAATYVFARRLFSPGVAIGALAWMSISLWPVFFARVGLRGISLPLLTTLTAYFLWRALFDRDGGTEGQRDGAKARKRGGAQFILPGVLLGLSLYTYQASRVFPLIFGLFLFFVFVQRRQVLRNSAQPPRVTQQCAASPWDAIRSTLTFFFSALIVAAPLILYLTVINPSAEARVADLSGPLNKLREGDPGEVISSTLNTLGMFTSRGDAVPIYNVSGRPVFPEIFGAALFVIGLLICLWRWKQPAYALLLLWFFISLIPAMVTPFSPNFVRTIASWPAPFAFVGIAMNEIGKLVGRRSTQKSTIRNQKLVTAGFALALIGNAVLTYNAYFVQWPTGDYVRFWQQAAWQQAARTLNADPSSTPIAASGLSIHDFDPQTFDLLNVRSDLNVKWFDCRQAVLYPLDREQPTIRYLLPPYYQCDADLAASYLPGLEVIQQPQWPDSGDTIFLLAQFQRSATLSELLLPRVMTSTVYLGAESFDPLTPTGDLIDLGLPVFEDLMFYGSTPHPATLAPGGTLTFDTIWQVGQPISTPLKIFIHLTAPDGRIVAQWDGLDVNITTLDPGDLFVQRHRLELSADLPPGPYRLSLGVYQPDSSTRLRAQWSDRTADSVVLGMLTLD